MDKILAPIKQRIIQFIDFKGFEKKNFFENLEISASNFRSQSLFSEVGGDVIAKISSAYPEINTEWLLIGKGPMLRDEYSSVVHEPGEVYTLKTDRIVKEQQIPLYDIEASAGVVELFINKSSNKPIDFISIPNLPKCDGAVYVTGDSMYPLLKSGDIVMYKELDNSIDNIFFGEMYLLSIDLAGEEFVTVKWVNKSEKGEEFIKIVSQNSHHQPKDIHLSKVKAMALIKASIRINSMS